MTNEESIEVLKDLWRYEHSEFSEKDIREALEMAISALSKTTSETEIRTEESAEYFKKSEVLEMQHELVLFGHSKMIIDVSDIEQLSTYSAEQTENPTKDIYSAIEYWKSVDEDNKMVKWLTELQEYRKAEREKAEQTYDWCNGCKEYDTEKHCCHRYSSFIRESLQENINAVLEDIKAEIEKEIISEDSIEYINGLNMALMIINEKHISGKEKKNDL